MTDRTTRTQQGTFLSRYGIDWTMPECQNCGSFVTTDFKRVFAGNDGEVHGCFNCLQKTDVKDGAATQT